MKKTSRDRLEKFLRDEYMKKGGADNMSTAVRDCLTDMFHLWDTFDFHNSVTNSSVTLQERVWDAHEVYNEEKNIINIRKIVLDI
jgi:hypothetical protein